MKRPSLEECEKEYNNHKTCNCDIIEVCENCDMGGKDLVMEPDTRHQLRFPLKERMGVFDYQYKEAYKDSQETAMRYYIKRLEELVDRFEDIAHDMLKKNEGTPDGGSQTLEEEGPTSEEMLYNLLQSGAITVFHYANAMRMNKESIIKYRCIDVDCQYCRNR
jgi:hypothetical protein